MKTSATLLLLSVALMTSYANAAQVECLISGTPKPQKFTADYCSSFVNSAKPSVVFRFVANKPVAEVQWTYFTEHNQRWECNTGTQCSVQFESYQHGYFNEVSACVSRVLYTDNTWENVSSCATGSFSGYGHPGS